ncbi:MAG: helix-turn-helix transcriptional regulator [Fimbriimonadaceae bacterium]|nr:helix-turn-helix transcriptional regulator [Fimbriimonadaceae bacterium]
MNDEQIAVLNSPARQEILFGLIQLERATVNSLAAHIGRTPKSLYHHIRQLEEAHLILRVATQRSVAREEAIYAPVSTSVRIPRNKQSIEGVNSIMRQAAREQINAFERNPSDDSLLMRISLKLDKNDQDALRNKLRDISEWIESRANSQGDRISLTIAFAPLEGEN